MQQGVVALGMYAEPRQQLLVVADGEVEAMQPSVGIPGFESLAILIDDVVENSSGLWRSWLSS